MTPGSPRVSVLALVFAASTGCADLDIGGESQPQIMWNQIMWNQIMWNALTGTPESIDELISYPLEDDSFRADTGSPVLAMMLHDPNAQVFMEYLVSCALEPDQGVSWEGLSWRGAAGLCPDWASAPPSTECQELVSACLLARNNKKGKSVQFSPRGAHLDGAPIPTAAQVPVKWTDSDGDPIASLAPCGKFSDPANCGWNNEASLLGQCEPFADVAVDCGGLTGASIRVCAGVEGCDDNAAIDEATCGVWWFEPPVAFTCPASGVYGVMQRRATSSYNAEIPTAPGFPETELALYNVREGAFYGNLFDASKRSPAHLRTVDPVTLEVVEHIKDGVPAVIYRDLWACNAPGWDTADAYMHDRLCALVETEDPTDSVKAEMCVATALGPCQDAGPTSRCDSADGAPIVGDGDYQGCRDSAGAIRSRAITTFLDGPCAMASDPDSCGYTP